MTLARACALASSGAGPTRPKQNDPKLPAPHQTTSHPACRLRGQQTLRCRVARPLATAGGVQVAVPRRKGVTPSVPSPCKHRRPKTLLLSICTSYRCGRAVKTDRQGGRSSLAQTCPGGAPDYRQLLEQNTRPVTAPHPPRAPGGTCSCAPRSSCPVFWGLPATVPGQPTQGSAFRGKGEGAGVSGGAGQSPGQSRHPGLRQPPKPTHANAPAHTHAHIQRPNPRPLTNAHVYAPGRQL